MNLSELHFSHPLWLWTLVIIPLIWALFFLYYGGSKRFHQLEKFIDKHLIPYLLSASQQKKKKFWIQPLLWSFVWTMVVVALAGPRWSFTEISTFSRTQSLAILLDLSESMNAKDILPSRLARAKQKIEDLLNFSKGVKIGLVVFAADPHMIVPLTEDKETIRHLLPSLDTDLIYVQGSKLTPALEMGVTMLENEPCSSKAIVVISDGGFDDASALQTVKKIAEKGVAIHTIGVGSLNGAPLKNREGSVIKKNGSMIISKLEKDKFSEISKIGHGRYFNADHSDEVSFIFQDLEKRSDVEEKTHKTQRFWKEHFYLFVLPTLPFFLFWYRRGYIFSILLLSFIPSYSHASLLLNQEQKANKAYELGDYKKANDLFQDPYKKGVASYRLGDYKTAEEMFRKSIRQEVASSAAYNLGNSLALQNKLEEAITVYENLLEKWPDHKEARENLEIVKQIAQEKKEKEEKEQSENSSKEEEKSQKEEQSESEKSSENLNQKNKPDQEATKSDQEKERPIARSQEDLDADLWLDQIKNDSKSFLKKKFYLESKKNGTKQEVDPW
jgi:Ca-activated chloride channel family protein